MESKNILSNYSIRALFKRRQRFFRKPPDIYIERVFVGANLGNLLMAK